MSLTLRFLKLDVEAVGGSFGFATPFQSGLVILRGDQSCGKSTCVQSISYALGLEQMLGTHDVPLPPSMTKFIEDSEGIERRVLQSHVMLELQNHKKEIVTVCRMVSGEGRDPRLVTVIKGPALSDPGRGFDQEDYFLRDGGAATRSAGFHAFLTQFIGWELPMVSTYRGPLVPLYPQCIFPLAIVEQKHGWSGIQATTPRFLGIREVERRAFEFVNAFDATSLETKRQQIAQREDLARRGWGDLLREALKVFESRGASVKGLPAAPMIGFPGDVPVQILVVGSDGSWKHLDDALKEDRSELDRLTGQDIPTAQEVTREAQQALDELRAQLAHAEAATEQVFSDLEGERNQIVAIDRRLVALADDIEHYLDLARLRRFGSTQPLHSANGECPTCKQALVDSLLPQSAERAVLSIDDNLTFLREQRTAFEKMRENCERRATGLDLRLTAFKDRSTEVRAKIRAWKATLVSAGQTPSFVAVRRQLQLEDRVRQAGDLDELRRDYTQRFSDAALAWRELQEEKAALPEGGLSRSDIQKMETIERLFRKEVRQFGFSSFSPDLLGLSRESYMPTREGFDLSFDISASDGIRMIWAYNHSLLNLSGMERTNHPGFLVFDEPQQQKMKEMSFAEFLKTVAQNVSKNQQVIFATSEELGRLTSMLDGLPHQMIAVEGKFLKKRA